MLESARVLAQEKNGHSFRFIGFTLEEGNPVYELRTRNFAQSLGLTDENHRYTTERTHNLMKQLVELQTKAFTTGKNPAEALAEARSNLENQLSKTEIDYLRQLEEMYGGITATSWLGKTAMMGSGFWVEKASTSSSVILRLTQPSETYPTCSR